jgi:hypothetical protein
LPRLPHHGLCIERLAVLVLARVTAEAAAAAMLVEEIRRERNFIASPASGNVAKRFSERLPDNVQTRHFDRGICAGVAVERVLTRHEVRLRPAPRNGRGLAVLRRLPLRVRAQIEPKAGQSKRIHAHNTRANSFQCGQRAVPTICLADAGKTVRGLDLDNRSQSIGCMTPVRAPQRSVGDGHRMKE